MLFRWVRVRCLSDPSRAGLVPENYLSLASLSASDAETREYLLLHQSGQPLTQTAAASGADGVLNDANSVAWNKLDLKSQARTNNSRSPVNDGGGSTSSSSSRNASPIAPIKRAQKYEVLYQFDAEGGDELTVTQGQCVWTIQGDTDDDDPGWLRVVDENGVVGIVPETYVRLA